MLQLIFFDVPDLAHVYGFSLGRCFKLLAVLRHRLRQAQFLQSLLLLEPFLLLLEARKGSLKLLLRLNLSDVILPLRGTEGDLLSGGLPRHTLLVECHVESVMHQAGFAEHGRACPTISLDRADLN